MTYSFLERNCQPAVDLANDREESIPFVVLSATFIPIFLSRKCFLCFSVTHLVEWKLNEMFDA